MSPDEYIITLISILVGLALADLATSVHRLIRAGSKVRWHGAAIAFAALVLFTILDWWWSSYQAVSQIRSIADFLIPMVQLIILFLMASAALPDDMPADRLSLRDYYFDTHRYTWLLFAAYAALSTLAQYVTLGAISIPNIAATAMMVALAVWKSRWLHYPLLCLILGISIVTFVTRQLPEEQRISLAN